MHCSRAAQAEAPKKGPLRLLILGKSGAGKTVFINGAYTQSRFRTFEEAKNSEQPAVAAPATFRISSALHHNGQPHEVTVTFVGDDATRNRNERLVLGESATQDCSVYNFVYDFFEDGAPRQVQKFDPPGVGDTKGIEQDTNNISSIVATLRQNGLPIHGIVFIDSEARHDPSFMYVFSELLSLLPKDAKENIVFCITKCGSGEGEESTGTIGRYIENLNKEKGASIHLDYQNSFFPIENDYFLYLQALRAGMKFTTEKEADYKRSFNKTRAQLKRLLERIATFGAIDTQKIEELHDRRRILECLTTPLLEAQQIIVKTTAENKAHNEELSRVHSDISGWKSRLYTPVVKFKDGAGWGPGLVCGSCLTTLEGRSCYDKNCCYQCPQLGSTEYGTGDSGLLKCKVFSAGGYCTTSGCGHHYSKHRYPTTASSVWYTEQVLNDNVQAMLNGSYSQKEVVEAQIAVNDSYVAEITAETEIILEENAKIVDAIEAEALKKHNDGMEKYLKQCRSEASKDKDDEAVRRLDEQLAKYMKLRDMYQQKRSKATCDPRNLDIKTIIDKLISLRRMGPHISTSIQKHIAAKEAKASE